MYPLIQPVAAFGSPRQNDGRARVHAFKRFSSYCYILFTEQISVQQRPLPRSPEYLQAMKFLTLVQYTTYLSIHAIFNWVYISRNIPSNGTVIRGATYDAALRHVAKTNPKFPSETLPHAPNVCALFIQRVFMNCRRALKKTTMIHIDCKTFKQHVASLKGGNYLNNM